MKTTRSSLLLIAIWIYVVGGALVQGFNLPSSPIAQKTTFPWPMLVLIPIVVIIGALFTKEFPGQYSVGKYIDHRLGEDTYRQFMKALKPELLFSSGSFCLGLVGIARTVQLGGPSAAYPICGFFISAGVAFLIAYFIGRRRKLYEKPASFEERLKSGTGQDERAFWKQVNVRRNLFFAVFFGWLVAGPALMWTYSWIFPGIKEDILGFATLGT